MSEANKRLDKYNAYDVEKLEDDRRRVTRRWYLREKVDMFRDAIESMVFQPFGTPDGVWNGKDSYLSEPRKCFPECVLIEQRVTPGDFREEHGKFVLTKVYEEIFKDRLYDLKQDERYEGDKGRRLLFKKYICFTSDVENLLANIPQVAGYDQGKIKTEQHGVYTIVTALWTKETDEGYYFSERWSYDPDGGVKWVVRYRGDSVTAPDGYIKTDHGYDKDDDGMEVKFEEWYLPPVNFIYSKNEGSRGHLKTVTYRYVGSPNGIPNLPRIERDINYNVWGKEVYTDVFLEHDIWTSGTLTLNGLEIIEIPGFGIASASSKYGLELRPAPPKSIQADVYYSYGLSGMGDGSTNFPLFQPPKYSAYYENFRTTDGQIVTHSEGLRGYYGYWSGVVINGEFRDNEVEIASYGVLGEGVPSGKFVFKREREPFLLTSKGMIYRMVSVVGTI